MGISSAVRNTCFALLSAIECDIRELIEQAIAPQEGKDFLPSDVRAAALGRHAFDHKESPCGTSPRDVDLLPYMDFGDLSKVLGLAKEMITAAYGPNAADVSRKIEEFAAVRNRVCHSRPLEEEDFPACLDLAKTLVNAHGNLPWTLLRETQGLLAENPGYVVTIQIPEFWKLGAATIRNNLPLPDYDETGFLGRLADRTAVRKYLLAPHPVVTIVGEGGVGKSALAIQCLYDLLSLSENPPFQAIIWTSLKTKSLSATGVSDIKNSIASTLGIIENVARELGASPPDQSNLDIAIQEILEYMGLFRILLVIDNYETITDRSLRPLLSSVPPGSKVLLTSRVGLGELEIRYKLDPLDLKTSVSLLRKYSKSINVELLYAASDKKLERYCQHLYFNPLLIKWYAQSASLGSDPEKLLSKGNAAFDEVLRYCFENLFSRLNVEERSVLHFLAAARRPLTPTELLFLMQDIKQIEPVQLDRAISTLHSSSMLKRSPLDNKSRDGAIQLTLTDVSSDYIGRFAPPEKSIFEKIQLASKKLSLQIQLSSVRQAAYKFDLHAVRASTRDQRIVALYLNTALELSRRQEFDGARKQIEKAKALLPTFAEIYRVSALVESRADEPYKALQEIEEAIQWDPDSALIRYQFANFLTNNLEDYDRALIECDAAIRCAPNEWPLVTLRAMILTRLGRYSEAAPVYEAILKDLPGQARKWRVSTRDQAAECYRRYSEQDRAMKNGIDFRSHIDRACTIVEEALAANDFDRSTGRLYTNIIEDALFFAIKEADESYASILFGKLNDAVHLLRTGPFRALTTEKFESVFGVGSPLAISCKDYQALCS